MPGDKLLRVRHFSDGENIEMSNGLSDGVIVGLPLWVKVSVVLGFPTVIALILLAALLGWVPSPMITMLDVLKTQAAIQIHHDMDTQALRRELLTSTEYQAMLMRTICRSIVPAQSHYQCEPRYKGWEEKEKER